MFLELKNKDNVNSLILKGNLSCFLFLESKGVFFDKNKDFIEDLFLKII